MHDTKNIFISHSSENKMIARELCNFMTSFGIQRNQIFCSSIIGQGIKNGEKLNDTIHKSINNSKILIFLLSADFLKSSYCMEELGSGWYLAENKEVKCYYLVLPDIFSFSEVQGFVNSKIDKFSPLNDRGELGQFADNLCEDLEMEKPSYSSVSSAIETFIGATDSLFTRIVEKRHQSENKIIQKEKEFINLKENNKQLRKTTNILTQQLEEERKRNKLSLLEKEYHTIELDCCNLSTQFGVSKEKYNYIGEHFWFTIINRYLKIREELKKLEYRPIYSSMDMTIATIYSAYGDYDKSYEFLKTAMSISRSTIYPDSFQNIILKNDNDTHELIEIFEKKIEDTDDGIIKKSYEKTLQYLINRNERLKKEKSE